ncbi:maleylpyruvate isomerase N-terminal domain-containing protein [Nonomuraea jiangxiensis]|uniref:maleylpyruvate isomerase N-terminal domain-containing protein n=1 Tax=Nonomuraea jiangxiensis TaxID=633440 RepID=UPI000B08FE40
MNTTTATVTSLRPVWRAVLAASYRALEASVAGVRDDQWDNATPCSEWTVTQVIQHAAGDQLAYAKMLGIGKRSCLRPLLAFRRCRRHCGGAGERRHRADRRGVGDGVRRHRDRPDAAAAR